MRIGLFTDVDFAGDRSDMKSTSGCFLAVYGPNSLYPLTACSKKQTSTSLSTTEADAIAYTLGLKQMGMPATDLWTTILGRDVTVDVFQDNQATMLILINDRFRRFGIFPGHKVLV